MRLRKKRMPFYAGITTLVVVIVIVLSVLFLWINRESKVAAIRMADHLFTTINQKGLQLYEDSLESVALLTGSFVKMPSMTVMPLAGDLSHPGIPVMLHALSSHKLIFSFYCGYEDGSFIQVIAAGNNAKTRQLYHAPEQTAFILRTIAPASSGSMQQHWLFLDHDIKLIGKAQDIDPGYDPRRRAWYTRAKTEQDAFFTPPYVFSSSHLPGITCARRLMNGGGVLGCDITLTDFSRSLKEQQISTHAVIFVFEHDGRIILNPGENPVHSGADNQLTFFKDNDHGFDMPMPDYLFNQGELHNLSICKGTLSEEDRFKINEHIVRTINMLDQLDFPDYLANVPEFAGAHHETMNGTGYPCKRKREEMSVQARIMAIADIFEALTAADHPYNAHGLQAHNEP